MRCVMYAQFWAPRRYFTCPAAERSVCGTVQSTPTRQRPTSRLIPVSLFKSIRGDPKRSSPQIQIPQVFLFSVLFFLSVYATAVALSLSASFFQIYPGGIPNFLSFFFEGTKGRQRTERLRVEQTGTTGQHMSGTRERVGAGNHTRARPRSLKGRARGRGGHRWTA